MTTYLLVDRLLGMTTNTDMQERILQCAENFIQTKGYNAFSYRDIANIVGIKTSSIHYYYPNKADLGQAVVKKHLANLYSDLETISHATKYSSQKKLDLFFDGVLAKTYQADRKMCLGGMLASDILTLPQNVQDEVRIFFRRLEQWLEQLLLIGKKNKEFYFTREAKTEASIILAMFEGALLLARLYDDEERLNIVRKQIKTYLGKK